MGISNSGKKKQTLFPLFVMLAMMIGIPVLGIRESLRQREAARSSATQSYSQAERSGADDDFIPLSQQDSYTSQSSGTYGTADYFNQSYTRDSKGLYNLTCPVMDTAHVLSESEYNSLNSFLMNLSDTTGAQIAVLTVQSLEGRTIEEFSIKHAEKWQLGQKGVDNGALLTVAMTEHDVRIETGYGTEGILTDAKCSRIIRTVIVPNFQAGRYGEGITEAVRNMAGIITSDDSLVSSSVSSDSASSGIPLPVILFMIVFMSFYVFAIVYSVTHAKKGGSSNVHITPTPTFHNHSSFSGGGGFHGGGGGFGGGGASGHW